MLQRLAESYELRIGQEFFDRLDAHLTQTNWVVLHDKLCFARLEVALIKRSSHMTGSVQNALVLSSMNQEILVFWKRVLEWCGDLIAQHRQTAEKVANSLCKLCNEDLVGLFGAVVPDLDSTSYSTGESQTQVKTEHSSEEVDLQGNFRDLLEPVSQPAQPPRQPETQTQYLTQLQSLDSQPSGPSQPRREEESRSSPNESSEDLFTLDLAAGQLHTLAQLNKVPLKPDNRIYKTKAYIAGTVPRDLTHLCSKVYEELDGGLCLSDPHLEPLELILVDPVAKSLTPENSLLVLVPTEQILSFMGLQLDEQLYTQLERIQALFKQRQLTKIPLELTITSHDSIAHWTARNLTLAAITAQV